jgi:hypothetical protein
MRLQVNDIVVRDAGFAPVFRHQGAWMEARSLVNTRAPQTSTKVSLIIPDFLRLLDHVEPLIYFLRQAWPGILAQRLR